jgi:DcuC family C4-dicarboxylate transporter
MQTFLLILGIIIIVCVIVLLVKQVETRFVLFAAGLLMFCLGGDPMGTFAKFESMMITTMLIKTICSSMGFAYAMKATQCDAHLIHILAERLVKFRYILIPGAMLITAFVNISLPAAAGAAAAVGAVIIPLLINLGVRPAMAATAIFGGTFGSMLSPGWPHNAFVGNLAGVDAVAVIAVHSPAVIVALCINATCLAAMGFFRKEDHGHVPDAALAIPKLENPKILFALMPVVPVALLMLSSYVSAPDAPAWGKSLVETIPALKSISVPAAMVIGTILSLCATRTNPGKLSRGFFSGMGHGYSDIIGIIIAAGVFVGGMQSIGLVDFLINTLKGATEYARYATALGPFFLAFITGSGDAATLSFNQTFTPQAQMFGMNIIDMGALAAIGGSLGRTMSPLAGAAIICAGFANINPMEIAKRNALGMIISIIFCLFWF